MSISSRIWEMNNHLLADYEVLTLAGADLTNVDKNIVNLKMSWKERLLYFMNNGTDIVWNNWNKVTGSGTTLSINGTVQAPMSLTYKGNTSQSGTPTPTSPIPVQVVSGDNSIKVEGKNLFDPSAERNSTYTNSIATALSNFKTTGKYAAGYSSNGTSISNNNNYVTSFTPCQSGVTYTINNTYSAGANFSMICFLDDNGNVINHSTGWTNNAYTHTATSEEKYIMCGINMNDNGVDYRNYVMIEIGSTATTYEEYKSANYPIDLGVENLLNASINKQTINGVTFTPIYNDDSTLAYIIANGTASANIYFTLGNVNVKANTSYLLSGCPANDGSNAYRLYAYMYDSNNTYLNVAIDYGYGNGITFSNANLDHIQVGFTITSGKTVNNFKIYPMVELRTTKHSYTPYGRNPIELNKISTYQDYIFKSNGKNMFDKNAVTDSAWLLENGTLSTGHSGYYVSDFMPVEPNTTYYKYYSASARNKYYDKNKQPLNTTTYQDIPIAGNAGTFTTPDNCYYVRMTFLPSAVTTLDSFMVNEGTTALPYEPYGKDWYLKKETGKVVLDGSENWTKSSNTNVNRYYIPGTFINTILNVNTIDLISDYFTCITPTQSDAYNVGLSKLNNTSIMANFSLSDTSFDTLQKFKTWLGTHNTIVYYVLATPTYTEITDSTLLSQLNALAKSYASQTNISQTNNDLPFELSVTALGELS